MENTIFPHMRAPSAMMNTFQWVLAKGSVLGLGFFLGQVLCAQSNWQTQSQTPGANYYAIKAAHDSVPPDDTTGDGEEAKYRRFDAFWASRVETGDPSVSGLLSNYTNKLSEYFTEPLCPTDVNAAPWEQMGPDHYSTQHLGRVQAMWVDPATDPPQLIYVGTTHSGLWRSTDGAATWTNITDSYARPVLGVHAVARTTDLSPTRIIIGTGRQDDESFSIGALYSDDDGANWHPCSGIPPTSWEGPVVDIKIHGSEVLALRGKHLYLSIDHGATFVERTPDGGNTGGFPPDVTNRFCGVVHYQNGGDGVIVLAAKQGDNASPDDADLYASSDLGLNWTRITDQVAAGTLVKLSQVCLVDDPGGDYHGFHILVEGTGPSESRMYSGTDPTQITLTHTFSAASCNDVYASGFTYRYDNMAVTKHGRVYTSGVHRVCCGQIAQGACQAIPLGNSPHADQNTFVVLSGATAGDDRIAVGHDGGMSYRDVNGTWHDWNGQSFPTIMASHIGVDEFASHFIIGTIDNGTWRMDPGVYNWNFEATGDGGMAKTIRSKDGLTWAETKILTYSNSEPVYLSGQYQGSAFTNSHSYSGSDYRLYWPCVLRFVGAEPTMWFIHGQGSGQPARLYKMTRTGPALELTLNADYCQYLYNCTALDVHPANTDLLFYATGSNYWDDGDLEALQYRLMRSSSGGASWTDLSQSLTNPDSSEDDQNLFRRYGVNSIAMEPDSDPDDLGNLTVYAGMAGVPNDDGFERVFKSTDGGDTWTDMSIGLPGFPVNYLACQPGSGGVVYAATDVGVFVYDPALGEWQCFNEGLPICIVTGLEVNMCSGKLYASTYGRSTWQADLYMPPSPVERLITEDVTITDLVTSKTIRVTPGNTLTVTGKLEFHPPTGLIIEQGARVIVDGGILTSRCPTFWSGVEVRGNSTQNQTGYPLAQHQGRLDMINGGRIENAEIGALACARLANGAMDFTKTGGIIYANQGNFKNCGASVMLLPWPDPSGGLSLNTVNRSRFTRSNFIVDSDYPGAPAFGSHVVLWRVYGIDFVGCAFSNLKPDSEVSGSDELGEGIYALDAKFTAKSYCADPSIILGGGCNVPVLRSSFEGLDHAIEAGDALTTRNFTVTETDFINNICGVYANGVVNPVVKDNHFLMGGRGVMLTGDVDESFTFLHRAVFTTESYSTRIDDNHIEMDANALAQAEGVVVGYCRDHNDVVFRNQVSGLVNGYVGEGINADPDNQTHVGLWWLCNENNGNGQDLYCRIPEETEPEFIEDNTVRLIQGASDRPADNTFDRLAETPADGDFKSDNDQNIINYRYRVDPGALQYDPIGLTEN